MKKFLSTIFVVMAFTLSFSQTVDSFFGVPMKRDIMVAAEEMKNIGFEVISYSNDSISLKGLLEPFGECQVVLYDICQKITYRNNENVYDAIKGVYGDIETDSTGIFQTFHIPPFRSGSIRTDSIVSQITILDLYDFFTIKFKGVALGAPLKEVLPQLKRDLEYVMQYHNYTILKGKFAGFNDCVIYIDAVNDDDVVSVINVYFPQTGNWNTLLSQYKELKEALTEKYGEPADCIEKNIKQKFQSGADEVYGYKSNKISQLIKGKIDCHAIFKPSIFGEIKLSLVGYEDSNTGAVSLMYCDLLSLKGKTESADEDL